MNISSFVKNPLLTPIEIPFIPQNLTEHYKNELLECYLDGVYVATSYHSLEKWLWGFKYQSHREKWKQFPSLRSDLLSYFPDDLQDGLFVPVPMHWSRYFSRGFDPIWYIVKRVAKKQWRKTQKLLRAKFFHLAWRQSHLSREKRLANKYNSFTIKNHEKIPKTVILVDDVISTGSTVNECARILKSAGVERVFGIFLASNVS